MLVSIRPGLIDENDEFVYQDGEWDNRISGGGEYTAKQPVCFAVSMSNEEDAVEIVTGCSADVPEAEVLQRDQEMAEYARKKKWQPPSWQPKENSAEWVVGW